MPMRLGIAATLTDEDMAPAALARAVEDLGFDSLWLPEHTHLPLRADVPPALVEGVRLTDYRRGLDPMVALAAAATATTRIGLGTGILLVAQHDPIILAKQVATLDHLSGGRVTLGIGFGWNRAEAEDHGVEWRTRHARVKEYMGCLQALWSEEQAEYHGTFVELPPAWAWPKPVQQPRVRTLIGGGDTDTVLGAVADYADGWLPIGGAGLGQSLPRLRALAEANGRDPDGLCVVPFGTIASEGKLAHYAGLGVNEVILRISAGDDAAIGQQLETLAPLLDFAATLETT